ncbi:hypothetical protein HYDPIDRAFT_34786 [Hydnomerulius pinastri MD-312]|uniref:DNA 3'-5' helicase n=1 Tax=Hydnomerulius pinastri MD-312 TaxID=994086 RepID=A0A0C9VWY5_9AGAM|nr:hypothetical protein HYDPIDRAFT_34786 [Hydnomerulius pinastri MD-312]
MITSSVAERIDVSHTGQVTVVDEKADMLVDTSALLIANSRNDEADTYDVDNNDNKYSTIAVPLSAALTIESPSSRKEMTYDDEFMGFGLPTCSDPTTSDPIPLHVDNHDFPADPDQLSAHIATLAGLGLMIDYAYNLVICAECSEALQPLHIRSHVTTNHAIKCPPLSEFTDILHALGLTNHKPLPRTSVIAPIHGLPVRNGIKCSAPSCDETFASSRTFSRHHVNAHADRTSLSTECYIQQVFAFRGHKVVLHVDPNLAVVRPHGTLTDYPATLQPVTDHSSAPLNLSDNPRKLDAFLYTTRWDNVVKGLTTGDIQRLVALPVETDILFPIVQEVHTMFDHMCIVVEGMDVLTRRHLNTPKGDMGTADVENRPFGRPQTNGYLTRCANHWSRYICAVLRSVEDRSLETSLHLTVHQLSLIAPSIEAMLWKAVGIDIQRYDICTIREPTSRSNIRFNVTQVQEAHLIDYSSRIIEWHIFQSPVDRGLVFCDLVEDAKTIAARIIAPFYIGSMDHEVRSIAQTQWTSGHSRWLCATSAFAQGIDYGHVTHVVHIRIPKHITLHAQQSVAYHI